MVMGYFISYLSIYVNNEITVSINVLNFTSRFNSDLVVFMVFNVTFNNISGISWRSVLLVEENGVPGENYRPITSH